MTSACSALLRVLLGAVAVGLALACSREEPGGDTASPLPRGEDTSLLEVGYVLAVFDGTTIEVDIGGQVFVVRYIGVKVSDGLTGKLTFEEQALAFNRFLVRGKEVELETGEVESDGAGRLLRYVYVEGGMVNLLLLTNGYATVADYYIDPRHQTAYQIAAEAGRRMRQVRLQGGSGDGVVVSEVSESADDELPTKFGTLPALPGATDSCDYSGTAELVIKGNVDRQTGDRVYHVPGGLFYDTLVIDSADGDRLFCTEDEALSQGWTPSKR